MVRPLSDRDWRQRFFGLAVVLLFVYTAYPFLLPVLLGGIFSILFYPIFEWGLRKGFVRSIWSSVLTLGIFIGILLPMGFAIFFGIKTGFQQVRYLRTFRPMGRSSGSLIESLVQTSWMQGFLKATSDWFPVTDAELITTLQDWVSRMGVLLANWLSDILKEIPQFSIDSAVIVVSLFFFFLDGDRFLKWIRCQSVFDPRQTEILLGSFGKMCRSVIFAYVVSAIVQSFLFSMACLSLGTSDVAMISFLVFLSAFVPLVGSLPVTLSVVLLQWSQGHLLEAGLLAVVAIGVTVLDNFIRPLILKGAGDLHPLIAFVGIFGGIHAFGLVGVFLGPIVAGMFMVTIRIFSQKTRT
tara:strand:- start:8861 stop:9919 length:1059 start_codon:yes stop_codon:yes gene_type:complete